jgi:hypothetical protein
VRQTVVPGALNVSHLQPLAVKSLQLMQQVPRRHVQQCRTVLTQAGVWVRAMGHCRTVPALLSTRALMMRRFARMQQWCIAARQVRVLQRACRLTATRCTLALPKS